MKKYIAELIGTFILVTMGCGTAMLVGCDAAAGSGYILTALAFGLAIVAMAYSIGNISGCHVNPAVSISMFMSGRMNGIECIKYCISQIIGAIAGSAFLVTLFSRANIEDKTGAIGTNSLAGVNGDFIAGIAVELVLTFIFVITILGVTSEKAKHGSLAGLVIGLTLTFVHIFGIGLTGTSVNPARSLGPALLCIISDNTIPLSTVWVFIIGPIAGAILAALLYKYLEEEETKEDENLPVIPKAEKTNKDNIQEPKPEEKEEEIEPQGKHAKKNKTKK